MPIGQPYALKEKPVFLWHLLSPHGWCEAFSQDVILCSSAASPGRQSAQGQGGVCPRSPERRARAQLGPPGAQHTPNESPLETLMGEAAPMPRSPLTCFAVMFAVRRVTEETATFSQDKINSLVPPACPLPTCKEGMGTQIRGSLLGSGYYITGPEEARNCAELF